MESIKLVSKKWGYEKIIENNQDYCGKLLHIVTGCATSLHYHKRKHETFYLESGKVRLYFSNDIVEIQQVIDDGKVLYLFAPGLGLKLPDITMHPGDKFDIPPMMAHRIVALEDSKIYEFSTHHEDKDSIRLFTE
jgi:mannose-6-phosphate isomerase